MHPTLTNQLPMLWSVIDYATLSLLQGPILTEETPCRQWHALYLPTCRPGPTTEAQAAHPMNELHVSIAQRYHIVLLLESSNAEVASLTNHTT